MGPKLLLSDASTAERRALRWRLVVRGNTAVEFGVVPADIVEHYGRRPALKNGNGGGGEDGGGDGGGAGGGGHGGSGTAAAAAAAAAAEEAAAAAAAARVHKALHKCRRPDEREFDAAVGFSSTITVGSQLSNKVPVMKGSVVEVVARDGLFEAVVTNPRGAQELYWLGHGQMARTVPKPYRGAARITSSLQYDPGRPVRLALTCWAQGAFDVLGPPEAIAAASEVEAEAAMAEAGGEAAMAEAAMAGSP